MTKSATHAYLVISAGLGIDLGVLLTKRPDLLHSTATARVLQLLMEHEEKSKPAGQALSKALGSTSFVDKLVDIVKDPDSLLQGKASLTA